MALLLLRNEAACLVPDMKTELVSSRVPPELSRSPLPRERFRPFDPLETVGVPPKRSFWCVALCSPRAANAFTCASNRSREKVRQQSSTLALNGIRAERTLEDAPRC